MPPVTVHQQTTYSCLEYGCSKMLKGRGVAMVKEFGYRHLITNHAAKYSDTSAFRKHYKVYFKNYYKIK